ALERLQIEADIPVSDLPAAISYARRRKLGPFRTDPAERSAMRQKDMGALARRGFSQAVTMTVLGAADQEALEELLHEQEETRPHHRRRPCRLGGCLADRPRRRAGRAARNAPRPEDRSPSGRRPGRTGLLKLLPFR